MKIKLISLLALVAFMGASRLMAQKKYCIEKLILKNGSTYEGYLVSQKVGESVTFNTFYSIISTNAKNLSFQDREVAYSDLSQVWKDWANANGAFQEKDGKKTLTLSKMLHVAQSQEVFLIETGDHLKYLDVTVREQTFSWDSVVSLRRTLRGDSMLSGVNYMIRRKNGTQVKGQYYEQIIGQRLCLYNKEGRFESIHLDDIASQLLVGFNPAQSIFEQSPLLDQISLKDGTSFLGVITELNYTGEAKNHFLILNQKNGSSVKKPIVDVVNINKVVNQDYTPLFDIKLSPQEIRINRNPVSTIDIREIEFKKEKINIFPADSNAIVLNANQLRDGQLILEANFPSKEQTQFISVLKLSRSPLVLKNENTKKDEDYLSFTYEDLIKNKMSSLSESCSINNTTKLVYPLKGAGHYMVYFSNTKRLIHVMVK